MRTPSEQTIKIRAILADSNGEVTYKTAQADLKKAGIVVDANTFGVIKSNWKKAKEAKKTRRKVGAVSPLEALEFVKASGGLAKAVALVERQIALVRAAKQYLKDLKAVTA